MIKKTVLTLFILIAALSLYNFNYYKDTTTFATDSFHKTENIQIINADDALERLKKGNERFLNDKSELINISKETRQQLTCGQRPYAVIVSCSDSRVAPNHIFNAGLGEIFEIRIAGNVVDKDALGSIEYGVEHLNIPLIVVMGHEDCGAVIAAYNKVNKGAKIEGNLNSIVDKIEPSIYESKSLDEAIHKNINNVMLKIQEDEIVKKLIQQGNVKIIRAYYFLDGKVTFE